MSRDWRNPQNDGGFLYVTDAPGGRSFGYHVNGLDGSLTEVVGSPFSLPSGIESQINVVDSSGRFLYVTQANGGIAAFAITPSTGTLASAPGSPFPTRGSPVFMAAAPVGNFLYSCNIPGRFIDSYVIDSNSGSLTPIPSAPFSPGNFSTNIVIDPTGKLLYLSDLTDSLIYGFNSDPVSDGRSRRKPLSAAASA
jgi:6-phosphogluconolactonase